MLNVSYHSPLMRTLQHASYAFRKRLSHAADSQDQRHRMVPGSRPLMAFADTRQPDVVTPRLIAAQPEAKAEYDRAMARAWAAKNRLLELGVPLEFALYVLPNAKVIRFVESGPLIALLHKWTMRTCFNAQEEIYVASMEEVEQVRAVHPRLMRFIGPPCVRPQRPDFPALHRGHEVLRRAGLAGFSQRRTPALHASSKPCLLSLRQQDRGRSSATAIRSVTSTTPSTSPTSRSRASPIAATRSAFTAGDALGSSSFIMARVECNFRSQARLGDRLEVRIRVSGIGRSSFTFDYEIVQAADGRVVADGKSVQVIVRLQGAAVDPGAGGLPGQGRALRADDIRQTCASSGRADWLNFLGSISSKFRKMYLIQKKSPITA